MKKRNKKGWKGNQTLMKNSATTLADEKEEGEKAMWDCGSPLYDSHELVSLDHLIDRHLMAFPSLHGPKPINTTFTHHNSHDMAPVVMSKKVGSPEKSKESFRVITSWSKFWVKMRKKKDNEERRKKNKEMRSGLSGFIVDLLCCGGNKKFA